MSTRLFLATLREYRAQHIGQFIAIVLATTLLSTPAFAAPIAVDDIVAVPSNTTVFANDLAANDTRLSTDTYSIVAPPSNGTAILGTDGLLDYTPNIGFASTDTLTYSVDDGAGGVDTATVTFNVVLTSDFLTPAVNFIVGQEDIPTPLNLTVDPSLEYGGTLQDIIGVDSLYRSESDIGVAVTSTIPVGTTGINITGYATRNVGTAEVDGYNDDYELLSVNINLREATYSGRLTYSVLPNQNLATIDQYTWIGVPLGQSVLSDTSYVDGNWTGDSDPLVELVAGQIRITETIPLQIAYHVEYMTSDGESADFVSGSGDVQSPGDSQSNLAIPAELEPNDGSKKGYLVLTGNSAANGAHFAEEHKGFSRLVVDLESATVSGVIASERGERDSLVTTWAFKDYPLIDLRNTPAATPVAITASTATRVGDSTAIGTGSATGVGIEDDPMVYIDASGDLIIERASDHSNAFTTMYTSEYYLRTGLSSIASFVGVESDTTLFDSNPADGVDDNGKPVNLQTFNIPASSSIGIVQMSWQTIGGNATNENVGYGFAVIDLVQKISSGSITFSRATTPDLLAWQSVPTGTTMFGATDGGVPLYQSNKNAGSFTDGYAETARFTIINNADGTRTLEITATSTAGGNNAYADYIGSTQISWLGSEPFRVEGVPVTGILSHGSPTDDGGWDVDFADIPLLTISTNEHGTGELLLELLLSSTGEVDTIIVHVQPVADPPELTAADVVGYVGNPIALGINVGDSADIDGSETQLQTLDLSGVPTTVVLSASAGTVSNFGGGNWQVDSAALPTLSATGPSATTATVTINGTNTDTDDLDGDTVIEDSNNGSGVDELDSVVYQETFDLTILNVPTVASQVANSGTPTISGTAAIGINETLSVTVNSVTYTSGIDANLVDNGDGTWELTVPPANTIADGTYVVTASLSHNGGGSGTDVTTDELIIDSNPPAVPTVNAQTTSDATPVLTGTATVGPGETLSVTVDGITYSVDDGSLVDNGDDTWTLSISIALAEGTFDVTAAVTDTAGNTSADVTVGELQVQATPLSTPTVVPLTTTDTTPTITGNAIVGAGDTFTVTVNGVTYTAGDGRLIYNSSGTWTLTIPTAMADGTYEVIATITDVFGNPYPDTSSDELIVDITDPVTPTVTSQITNNPTPTISGTATVALGEALSVTVDDVTYTVDDGNLVNNGDGTWDLIVLTPLSEATYSITATVSDAAGNSANDSSVDELIVDTTVPAIPTVTFQTTSDNTPVITGTAIVGTSETLSISVAGVIYTAVDVNFIDNGDGTWDLNIPTTLTDGDYSVTATINDAAGNAAVDATALELTVDTIAPVTPTVASQNTNSTSPTVNGTATVATGDTLSVAVDGVTYTAGYGYLTDNGDGTWELAVPATLAESTYNVTATVTDPAGNATSDTTSDELIIDLTAPIAPGVTSLNTTDTTPVIEGTATLSPGESLSITVNGITYLPDDGNLVDNGDGTWALTIPATNILAEGLYEVVASVTDAAGNTAMDPGIDELVVDLTAPNAPGVTSLTTNDTTPVIEGTATILPGETLTVIVNGITYTEGDANLANNGDGTWTLGISTQTLEGSYDVTATLTDSANNSSSDPSSSELLIDTTLPITPTTTPLITSNSAPTITGTANAGPAETLTVEVDGMIYTVEDGDLIDNGDGTWALIFPTALPDATYEVIATVTDAAGNVSIDTGSNELVIDTTAPVTPTITSLITNNNTPILTGTTSTAPGEALTVSVNGVSYSEGGGNLMVNADGNWNLSIPAANTISDGIYDVSATTTDLAANATNDATTNELTIDTNAPVIPTVTALNTSNTTPTLSGNAMVASGEILSVNVDGVTYIAGEGNLVVNAGTWNLNLPTPLPDGTYPVAVSVVDAAGNTSDDTTTAELTIDTTTPAVPTVTSQTTSNTTPTITGTAIVGTGESLTVLLDAFIYTTAGGFLVDNGDGTWDLTVPTAMVDNTYDVTATVTDSAGNSSDDITALELTIDTTDPIVPTVTSQVTNNTTPVIAGTATIGLNEVLTVTVNGTTFTADDGFLIDNGDGTWALSIATPILEGIYDVSATVSDAAGNASLDTTTTELVIDATAPITPTVVAQNTNTTSPVITGTAIVTLVDTLSVTVDALTYTAGDGFLFDNGDGTWALSIPVALAEGIYDVTATLTDHAGNTSSDATSGELIIDLTAPVAPGVTSLATTDTTPTVEGTATIAAGEILTVEVDGATYTAGDANLIDNTDGTWTLTIPIANTLAEDLYQVVATVTDAAGNSATDPGFDDLLVDLTAPSTPGVTSLTTNDTTPTIIGTAIVAVGETLTVTVNSVTYSTVAGDLIDNGDGTWVLSITTPHAEGAYDVTATITDSASNTSSDPSSGELLIDTTPPITPTVAHLITSNTTPTITGTANAGPGEILTVEVDSVIYTVDNVNLFDNGDGTWSLTIPTPLIEATYAVIATVTDAASNAGTDTSSNELVVDLTAPVAPTVNTLVTNNPNPVLTGTTSTIAGESLTVIVNGVSYSEGDVNMVVNADGSWGLSIPASNAISDGTYDVVATITDLAVNASSDATVSELTVDTNAPVIPTVTALNTSNTTPELSGNATVAAGEILTVMVDGVTYNTVDGNLIDNGDGTWDLNIPTLLADNTYPVVVSVVDAAGNVSIDITSAELVVDTNAPVMPTVNSQITNNIVPIIEGNATVTPGETLTVIVNGITYTAGDGNLVDNGEGTWALNMPTPLPEGAYDVVATVTDTAGNATSEATTAELIIDTTAPAAPTVTALTTNDNTPTVTGTAIVAAGDTLTVNVDGVIYTAGDSNLVDHGDGTWSLTIPTALADTSYEVIATVTDAAGNPSTDISNYELVIDTIAPVAPTINALLTNSSTPVLTGTTSTVPGETLTVTVNGVSYTEGDSSLVVNPNGTWELTIPASNAMSDSSYDVTATITDLAGNATIDTTPSELAVDTTAPVIPSVTALNTNNTTPTLSGTAVVASGEVLTVTIDGVTYTAGDGILIDNGDGTWTLLMPVPLAEGAYDMVATVTDAAGNATSDTSAGDIIIDLTAPIAPGVTSLTTADTTPVIEGTAIVAPGETLSVIVNDVTYAAGDSNLIDNDDGTWSLTIPAADALAENLYQIIATVTDAAGNNASDPGVDDLLVDITAPNAPGVTSLTTNNTAPIIEGTAIVGPGEILSVTVNGVSYTAGDDNLIDNGDGTWTLTLPTPLAEGSHDITATITDSAGNTSSNPSSGELLIDTTLPITPTAAPLATNNTTPTITGTANAGPGETLTVSVDGVTYTAGDGNLTDNGDGTWSLSIPTPLADGRYSVIATVTDAAGNVSTDGGSNGLLIDTTPPATTADSQNTTDTTPTLTGTTNIEPGDTLLVSVNGVTYTAGDGNLIDNGDGTWTLTIPNPLLEGDYLVQATVIDAVGNTTASEPVSLIVRATISADDFDGDGVPDAVDLDDDNDGIPDTTEGSNDSDDDGQPNYQDLDSDNDGIADIVEVMGEDTDNDYQVDNFTDQDNNGLSDELQLFPFELVDSDNDLVADFRDIDSDNDGLTDLFESGGTDTDYNGRIDNFSDDNNDGADDANQINGATGRDTDGDGVVNRLDLDSDGDTIFDLVEAGGTDFRDDGILDSMQDGDLDGIPDSVDVDTTAGDDIDNDGIDDRFDASITNGQDADSDGVIDSADPDADGDGFADAVLNSLTLGQALPDTNGNGEADLLEPTFNGVIHTGINGHGGCSINAGFNGKSSMDPFLILLIASSSACLWRRRSNRYSPESTSHL